jgi:hypothetical protein
MCSRELRTPTKELSLMRQQVVTIFDEFVPNSATPAYTSPQSSDSGAPFSGAARAEIEASAARR